MAMGELASKAAVNGYVDVAIAAIAPRPCRDLRAVRPPHYPE